MLQTENKPLIVYGASSERPFIHVPLPVLAGEPNGLWPAFPQSVAFEDHATVPHYTAAGLMLGLVKVGDGPLQETARQAYLDLFDFLDRERPDLSLLRIWNYVPDILAPDSDGVERYRNFNIGRHQAFVEQRSGVINPPAATGIGTFGGERPILFFIAGDRPGLPIENPRQISAYNYPDTYGPRSPSFSRSLLAPYGEGKMFFISGTASIVGHETRHIGDVAAQTRETIANLNTLIAEAVKQDFVPDLPAARLKVYVRHPEHLDRIRREVEAAFPHSSATYLHAEICRPGLLVEIEAAVPGR